MAPASLCLYRAIIRHESLHLRAGFLRSIFLDPLEQGGEARRTHSGHTLGTEGKIQLHLPPQGRRSVLVLFSEMTAGKMLYKAEDAAFCLHVVECTILLLFRSPVARPPHNDSGEAKAQTQAPQKRSPHFPIRLLLLSCIRAWPVWRSHERRTGRGPARRSGNWFPCTTFPSLPCATDFDSPKRICLSWESRTISTD